MPEADASVIIKRVACQLFIIKKEKGKESMKIAVTYDNGEVFQHFGRTENFKVYEIEDNKVISSEVISSNGVGHGALAGVLADRNVKALICGGIGGGAINALTEAGIEVCSGASGDTDKAVEDYLNGKLIDAGQTCDHHGEGHTCGDHEEGHGCGHHDAEENHSCGCGSHEGTESGEGCGCGCGERSKIEGANVGKTLKVHYTGTFNDGTKFDSSYDRGEPLEFVCGAGLMIKGFDRAVADMEIGQIKDIHLMPEEAYGLPDPNAIFHVEISQLPGAEELEEGQQVYLQNEMGQPFPVTVVAKEAGIITFDANHEMAGKELNFKIELVEIC